MLIILSDQWILSGSLLTGMLTSSIAVMVLWMEFIIWKSGWDKVLKLLHQRPEFAMMPSNVLENISGFNYDWI